MGCADHHYLLVLSVALMSSHSKLISHDETLPVCRRYELSYQPFKVDTSLPAAACACCVFRSSTFAPLVALVQINSTCCLRTPINRTNNFGQHQRSVYLEAHMSDVMLPTETTTDILSSLGLFDLSGTLLANEKLRDIALACSKRLKRWTFRVVRLRSYASGYKGHTQVGMFIAIIFSSKLPSFCSVSTRFIKKTKVV